MSTAPFVDPETAALTVSADAWEVLVRTVTGETAALTPPQKAAASELADARLLLDEGIDARIAPHLRAVGRATALMTLEVPDARIGGWLGPSGATIASPRGKGEFEVVWAPVSLLAEMLARLVALGPRPRGGEAALQMTPAELATTLATMGAHSPAALVAPNHDLGAIRQHWALEIYGIADTAPRRRVEVIDTERSLWLVQSDEQQVSLTPTTSTQVWLQLVELAREVDPGAAPR